MNNHFKEIAGILSCVLAVSAFAEAPYQFRERLVTVHRTDRRDYSAQAESAEYTFKDGAQIVVPDGADALTLRAADDFVDYLIVSMGVNASVRRASAEMKPGLSAAVEIAIAALEKPGYTVDAAAEGVKVTATDGWMVSQALCNLEDRMNMRKGPFLGFGEERRFPIFEYRCTFSGYGNDIFPDAHLNQLVHYGFNCIEVWLKDYDVISQGFRQDVNDLIDRALRFGIRVKLSPRNRAFVHPDDPQAKEMYDKAYGQLAKYYPKALGAGFCGEVCEFPSKDPRTNGRSHRDKSPKDPNDKRPNPGWFPCSDWADWVKMVGDILHGYNPEMKMVFSTYNWGNQDEQARADLINALPKGYVTLIPTFEMFETVTKRNGLETSVADYSLSFPGPGKYFASEAAQAKAAGVELWSNCNSAGLTWDFGNIPVQPAPWQWKKKWDGLRSAHEKWNLTGLRENHEYGWYPSFIAEMEKEYLTEGGMDFEDFARALAKRDFGEENVDRALEAWQLASRAADDYVPTDENQYGPCRIGPAYPFNFFGERLQPTGWKPPADFPITPGFRFTICYFDFGYPIPGLGMEAVTLSEADELKEIELFDSQVADYGKAAELFRAIAATRPGAAGLEARRQAGLMEYLMRACLTTANLKRGRIAWRKGDREAINELARKEYANASAALRLVREDSRLGWLCSSDYTGGPAQIEWKLRKMRELYGFAE